MRSLSRSHLLVVALTVGIVFLLLTASPIVEREPVESEEQPDVRVVDPMENGSATLWPYTSRGPTPRQATLPINVVVQDDASTVNRLLRTGRADPRLYWNPSSEQWVTNRPEEGNVTVNGTGVHWGNSAGSDRYTYIQTEHGGVWKTSSHQIHDGTYFGSRHHLRLYEGGSGRYRWTAIQAHYEYWDWFRLRHDVNSLSRSRHYIERDLLDSGLTSDVKRERWGNGGAIDADGWVTVIDLTHTVTSGPRVPPEENRVDRTEQRWNQGRTTGDDSGREYIGGVGEANKADGSRSLSRQLTVVPLIWLMVTTHSKKLLSAGQELLDRLRESRLDRFAVALFVSTALLPLFVRIGAITAERTFQAASPVEIGGPFYLLLIVGLPASAFLFGRHLPASDGFVVAVLGAGSGLMADYAYLGLVAVPFGALVQRLVLLFGLGLIAAGGTRWSTEPVTRHRYHTVGAAVWIVALLWPLLS